MGYSLANAVLAMTTLMVAIAQYDADTQTGSQHGLGSGSASPSGSATRMNYT
ncbi:hypothetical protein ACIA5G_33335 [Amycolatopsis sp. NPDC051758]|uniref:hypothetical protein n=1 Tax=Amycolatopsis sp. NPDC051758 TaxID=3363935 RepID=UPI003798CCDF